MTVSRPAIFGAIASGPIGDLLRSLRRFDGAALRVVAAFGLLLALPSTTSTTIASSLEGVASCAGSTCHGRAEGNGAVVRQDEIATWQEPSSASGAHSRAYAVLAGRRGQQIARSLGLGNATQAKDCLGCHATYIPGVERGAKFQLSDGWAVKAATGVRAMPGCRATMPCPRPMPRTWRTASSRFPTPRCAPMSVWIATMARPSRDNLSPTK